MTNQALDVLVIGGGVTGVGSALDAVSRGLAVGLVEQRDYGSGTSSRSSKMFHGGLRYLEQLQLPLVREALRERNLMINSVCPHLVRPTSFLYPLRSRGWERLYVGAGVLLYEVLARLADNPLPWHRHLGRRAIAGLAPAIDARGGVLYWDSVVDDARHTLTVARTAAGRGALLATSARAIAITRSDDGLTRVRILDLEEGREVEISARSVINATGVWAGDVERQAGESGMEVQASKGVHLVVPRDRIDSGTGIILRTDASVLFVIPWGGHWIVGTTDTPWSLRRAHPAASRTDIQYLLKWANTVLREPLRVEDVVGVYAGLRPLLRGESEQTSKLSREHAVLDNGQGMVTVAGGKYTTYRVMAKDAVDAAIRYLGRRVPASVTRSIPLVGASPYREDRLHGRYGALASEVRRLATTLPGGAEPVVSDAPYLMSEIHYAATHEGALHLDDVLTRRTRISVETRDRGVVAASRVAAVMAGVLGWDWATVARELAHYEARVRAELDSQSQPDDHTADAARMGALDVRTGPSE